MKFWKKTPQEVEVSDYERGFKDAVDLLNGEITECVDWAYITALRVFKDKPKKFNRTIGLLRDFRSRLYDILDDYQILPESAEDFATRKTTEHLSRQQEMRSTAEWRAVWSQKLGDGSSSMEWSSHD